MANESSGNTFLVQTKTPAKLLSFRPRIRKLSPARVLFFTNDSNRTPKFEKRKDQEKWRKRMDCNGNISENPFLKQDNAAKRLIRRRPIVIRDTDTKNADIGFKMKLADGQGSPDSPNSDFEYGPGIVEKLRAKFSKMSGAQKQNDQSFSSQTKKYSSCDDLLSENEMSQKSAKSSCPPVELQRRTSRSISDILENEDVEKPLIERNLERDSEEEETKSITQLRRRFEKNGEQLVKMRFARDPVQLITKFQPDHVDQWKPLSDPKVNKPSNVFPPTSKLVVPIHKPAEPAHKTSNVLKVLNDADVSQGEPEFVQIARRLRRLQPEAHDTIAANNVNNNTILKTNPPKTMAAPPPPAHTAPVRPSTLSMWQRRQPEVPLYSETAKIIRENCDIAVLPPDPHSARVSKQPISSISAEHDRPAMPVEASPPPEEPKPTTLESYSQFRKSIVDISSDRTAVVNSVFKYEQPSPISKSQMSNNLWKPTMTSPMESSPVFTSPTASKLPFISRKVDDVGAKSLISAPAANVVSISVNSPVSNRIYSNYDKSEETASDISSSSTSTVRSSAPLKPPTTYSPSYTSTSSLNSLNSVSLSSKYVEEKSKTSQQQQQQPPIQSMVPSNSLSGLLSPREKPYGDDVTILKSEPTNETRKPAEPSATNIIALQDESDENSDGDSNDGNGSYEITPMRPNSLVFTRLANEEEMGGDGNMISRSLLSLVAEEDLPDFLVALNEKPIRYVVVEESQKPSTSSILRTRDVKKEEKAPRGTTRIRFCTESPMAYAYLDEITATRALQWDDGTVIEYSYFKDLEAAEEASMRNGNRDPTLSLIEQWEQQIANDNIRPLTHESTFAENRLEASVVSSAY